VPLCIQDAALNELPAPLSTADGLVSYYLLGFDEPVAAVLLVAHTTAAPRGFTLLCQSLGQRLIEAAVPLLTTALSRDGLREDFERASEQARRDTLTGLANRLAWDEAVAKVAADGRPVSVVQLDCCSLKHTNDSFGHHTDRLLRTVAHIAASSVREPDLVARIGGDEFAILLVDADETVAASVVERVEQAVAAEPPIETVKITVAVGSATTRTGDIAVAQREADARMLAGKRQGSRS
jgi:diguanylate cyclase (GGDEF)-like protein